MNMRRKNKKKKRCDVCNKATRNAHLCQVGEDMVYLCASCCEDPTIDVKRSRLSSLYGFMSASGIDPYWKTASSKETDTRERSGMTGRQGSIFNYF